MAANLKRSACAIQSAETGIQFLEKVCAELTILRNLVRGCGYDDLVHRSETLRDCISLIIREFVWLEGELMRRNEIESSLYYKTGSETNGLVSSGK